MMDRPVKKPPFKFESGPDTLRALAHDWPIVEHKMPDLWRRGNGKGVLVFILDTGTPEHKDLPKPRFTRNFSDSRTFLDRESHATLCGGTVHQWAPGADLAYMKVLGDRGSGATTWTTQALREVVRIWSETKPNYIGCVVSMSLGGPFDSEQEKASKAAEDAGIVLVGAAGNSGPNAGVDSPGDFMSVIAVASYRRDGEISSFSSGGPEVDFAMPGEGVISTYLDNKYRVWSGTSAACPALAGLIACAISSRPNDQWVKDTKGMRKLLKKDVVDKGPKGHDDRFGYGIVSAPDALRNPVWWTM